MVTLIGLFVYEFINCLVFFVDSVEELLVLSLELDIGCYDVLSV